MASSESYLALCWDVVSCAISFVIQEVQDLVHQNGHEPPTTSSVVSWRFDDHVSSSIRLLYLELLTDIRHQAASSIPCPRGLAICPAELRTLEPHLRVHPKSWSSALGMQKLRTNDEITKESKLTSLDNFATIAFANNWSFQIIPGKGFETWKLSQINIEKRGYLRLESPWRKQGARLPGTWGKANRSATSSCIGTRHSKQS